MNEIDEPGPSRIQKFNKIRFE
mgnify:CR=1